jgi:Rrf2 family cysteine metabolism transcriptional repressor
MFSLTTKAHYGVSAMVELARNHDRGLLQVKEIVARRHIPKNYLEQIFNRLNRHGLLKSVRGNKGGYQLADDPSKISLLKVLEALEGEMELGRDNGVEPIGKLYAMIEEQARAILGISLARIALEEQAREQQIMYHI